MKSIILILSILFVPYTALANVGAFHGQWYLVVEGLPQGEVKMLMTVDGNSQPPIVNITDPTDASRLLPVEEVRVAGDSLSGRFRAMGVTMPLCIALTDGRNATGTLMHHFSLRASKDKLFDLDKQEQTEDRLSAVDTVWLSAPVRVDCAKPRRMVGQDINDGSHGNAILGQRSHPERYMNTTPVNHPDDARFLNEQGLHALVTRVWAGPGYIDEAGFQTAHAMSDYLLMSYGLTDASQKVQFKEELTELKRRFPKLRYVEAGNEYDYEQTKGVSVEEYYAKVFRPMMEAVNEVNRELQPEIPMEIGGPVSSCFNREWIAQMLDDYKADEGADKRLDFISYHGYFVWDEAKAHRLFFKDNPTRVCGQRAAIDAMLKERGIDATLPVFVSEMGIYPGPLADDYNRIDDDRVRQAAGMLSLFYWYGKEQNIYPFNWVLRHHLEGRKDMLVTTDDTDRTPLAPQFTPYGEAVHKLSMQASEALAVDYPEPSDDGHGLYVQAAIDDDRLTLLMWNYQQTGRHAVAARLEMLNLPDGFHDEAGGTVVLAPNEVRQIVILSQR